MNRDNGKKIILYTTKKEKEKKLIKINVILTLGILFSSVLIVSSSAWSYNPTEENENNTNATNSEIGLTEDLKSTSDIIDQTENSNNLYSLVNVNAIDINQIINSENEITIIDVRNSDEYYSGHIAGAKLILVSQLEQRLNELEENKLIIVYCKGGYRSAQASEILITHGFRNVYNMLGGINAWIAKGYPVVIDSKDSKVSENDKASISEDDKPIKNIEEPKSNQNNTTTIINYPPIADIYISESTVYTNDKITFDASTSIDEDGTIEEFFFDFGDGITTGWVKDPKIYHSYSLDGIYSVNLK